MRQPGSGCNVRCPKVTPQLHREIENIAPTMSLDQPNPSGAGSGDRRSRARHPRRTTGGAAGPSPEALARDLVNSLHDQGRRRGRPADRARLIERALAWRRGERRAGPRVRAEGRDGAHRPPHARPPRDDRYPSVGLGRRWRTSKVVVTSVCR
ncbi:hypothetical protein GCM10009854_04670 [Saccharopolyspora halophila]|uniref:Uncharacterized protein n=1 Tax=Saccharopolyspora halophila TaxID=405551 RepID=A0ABP5SJ93_9PSEU